MERANWSTIESCPLLRGSGWSPGCRYTSIASCWFSWASLSSFILWLGQPLQEPNAKPLAWPPLPPLSRGRRPCLVRNIYRLLPYWSVSEVPVALALARSSPWFSWAQWPQFHALYRPPSPWLGYGGVRKLLLSHKAAHPGTMDRVIILPGDQRFKSNWWLVGTLAPTC